MKSQWSLQRCRQSATKVPASRKVELSTAGLPAITAGSGGEEQAMPAYRESPVHPRQQHHGLRISVCHISGAIIESSPAECS